MSQQELVVKEQPRSMLVRPIAKVQEILEAQNECVNLIKGVLKESVDYGTIPGTQKPTLYKAGAERLCSAFGSHPEYDIVEMEKDHYQEVNYVKSGWEYNTQKGRREKVQTSGKSIGVYRYVVKCNIKNINGNTLASSIGSCSSFETKYVDRPRDMENTILKMAQKRAFVAATLNAFGLSDRFTQDMEDAQHDITVSTGSPSFETQPQKPTKAPENNLVVNFDKNIMAHITRLEELLEEKKIDKSKWESICDLVHGKPVSMIKDFINGYEI